MPPIDTESQFRFLISCIRNSSAGKVNFIEVAKECEIISKGAAAKRYERLMKAHGIQPGSVSGSVKKENGDSKDTKDPKDAKGKSRSAAAKKRKLAEVEDDAGDVDEPVKTEVKGEVKSEVKLEDAVNVKSERPSDTTTPTSAVPPSQSPPASANGQPDDEDDEVFLISATERRDGGGSDTPDYGNGHGHHHYHHSHSLAIPGVHSFDYANMGFPPQHSARIQSVPSSTTSTMTTPTMITSGGGGGGAFPYGFAPSPWMYPHHDAHSYL